MVYTRFIVSCLHMIVVRHYIFANITNKVALDDVALTYNTSTTYTDVSSTPYSRTVTGLSGTAKNNYTLNGVTNLNQEWNILQRTITFVWGSVSTITYNGSLQGIELAISNIAGTDVYLLFSILLQVLRELA